MCSLSKLGVSLNHNNPWQFIATSSYRVNTLQ
jgi:hypothetical protein